MSALLSVMSNIMDASFKTRIILIFLFVKTYLEH